MSRAIPDAGGKNNTAGNAAYKTRQLPHGWPIAFAFPCIAENITRAVTMRQGNAGVRGTSGFRWYISLSISSFSNWRRCSSMTAGSTRRRCGRKSSQSFGRRTCITGWEHRSDKALHGGLPGQPASTRQVLRDYGSTITTSSGRQADSSAAFGLAAIPSGPASFRR